MPEKKRNALLSYAQHLGVDQLYRVRAASCAAAAPAAGPAPAGDAGVETLDQIRDRVKDCRNCGLAQTRTHLVFGVGDPHASLMIVGEAPGRDEDLQGEPFVGRAGQLLTNMLKAIQLERADVYIANVLKCRPPNNRQPAPDEIVACSGILRDQIRAIRPRIILTLGTFATQAILNTTATISSLRGRFHPVDGVQVMPTFHPAYLLRNPDAKKYAWEDMKQVRALLRSPPA